MFWEDAEKENPVTKSEKMVDVSYKINCKQLPISHAVELARELYGILPWLKNEPEAAIHQIHGATSGNGWERPADGELLQLSRRTRMQLRIPLERTTDANQLSGKILHIAGESLSVGEMTIKPVIPCSTLFARYVVVPTGYDEQKFLSWIVAQLEQRHIQVKKMLCGMGHSIQIDANRLETRSLMVADLEAATSVLLQEAGLGSGRQYGCGIFLPHKGIKAVTESEDNSRFTGS